ncbi:MAG: hypothetical protein BYD32DRAFT_475158 [Podila humilis]|nr:MAG: hypothetical protein BYD32DRAFT_475158 [Podila humilis]
MVNPLLLPEIIHRLGDFITLWKTHPTPIPALVFHPQDLSRCIQVCRLWRDTLTPFLWAVYDDSFVRSSVDRATSQPKSIPQEAMEAHSQYLRCLRLNTPRPTLTQRLTCLRHISVTVAALKSCKNLLHANGAHLTNLTLKDLSQSIYMTLARNIQLLDEDTLPLINFPQLTHIQLENFLLERNDDLITRFLNANTQLTHFSLIKVHQWRSSSQGWACFPHLTQLTIYSPLNENPALLDLIRHCPALETLIIKPSGVNVYATLCKNLRECCPALTTVRCGRTWTGGWPGDMTDDDCVSMIQVSAHLVHVELDVGVFKIDLGQVLLDAHGQWLETLVMIVYKGTTFSFESLGKILQTCPTLVSFEMRCIERIGEDGLSDNGLGLEMWGSYSSQDLYHEPWQCPSKGLYLVPWQCPRLERVRLEKCVCKMNLIFSHGHGSAVEVEQDGAHGGEGLDDSEFLAKILVHGWMLDRDLGTMAVEMVNVEEMWFLRDKVFERILEQPRMRSFSIEGYEYSKRLVTIGK